MGDQMMRLQKYMALSGVASRRKSEEMIMRGKVKVNGQVVDTLGAKIDPDKDTVEVNNKVIRIEKRKIYIMLNKPVGYVSTVSDQFDRETVVDLVDKDIDERLYPVGRLDYDTEGLILLTNDGDFTYSITHPKHHIDKTYIATVKGIPSKEKLRKFQNGLEMEDYVTSPAKVEIVKVMRSSCELEITIHEGKNRQVRKMCSAIGHPVIKLKRVAIGDVVLGNLPLGKWRHLSPAEVQYLLKNAGKWE